jgi:hypothetical protein
VQSRLLGFKLSDQFGNAIERLLIQHSARDNPEALNLDIDFVALTAHGISRIGAS